MDFDASQAALSWFLERYKAGRLELKPPYQRRPVWAARQRCSLIDTILSGLPVPEIFIQRTTSPTGETTYAIVDGQQRIRTVLQFIGADLDEEGQQHNKFVLDKLDSDSDWRNAAFAVLTDETKARFFGFTFAVRYLDNATDGEVRDMFRRLNKFLTPLNAQELRNAIYTGPFIKLVERLADEEYWAENRMFSPASIRRMLDVQFVSELLIGVMHGPQGGGSKDVDEYYEQYEDYEDEFPGQSRAARQFRGTLKRLREIFPRIRESSRWSNRADFYSLFVALSALLRAGRLLKKKYGALRNKLEQLGEAVNTRLADEKVKVSPESVEYVRAVEKGVNDKARRARRHQVLLQAMGDLFD